jgi:hypothetical protein
MPNRQFRPFVLSIAFAFMMSTVPVAAVPRDQDGWRERDFSFINRIVKKVKKTFGVSANADTLTLPTP